MRGAEPFAGSLGHIWGGLAPLARKQPDTAYEFLPIASQPSTLGEEIHMTREKRYLIREKGREWKQASHAMNTMPKGL